MTARWLLTAAVVLAATHAVAAARVPNRRVKAEPALLAPNKPSDGPGQVTYVTADRVFVDRGAADGVAVGNALTVTRGGKTVGTCTVKSVTELAATCAGTALQSGDRLTVVRKPRALAVPLAPVPDSRELASRLSTLEATPAPLVDFEGGGPAGFTGSASTLEVVLSQSTFSNFSGSGGPYQLQRVDAHLRELRLWRALRVSIDMSALNWSQRPAQFGSIDRAQTELFIRQLELAWRDGRVDAAIGRIWTRHTPGLAMVDGAQAGLRSSSGNIEGGAFGGLLPNEVTLGPSLSQWVAGAYVSGRLFKGAGADAFWLEPEARVNWAVRDGVGGRLELGAALHAWAGRYFDAHALVQLGAVNATAPGLVDFSRLDIGIRPSDRVQFSLSGRYRGNENLDVLELGAPAPGNRGIHADGTALVDLKLFTLGANGGYARDIDSTLTQGHVGVQLMVPTLFGRAGALGVGYAEEVGWLPGRSAWVQLSVVPHWRVRVVARASWFMQNASASALGVAGQELGAALSLDLKFTTWLWLRLSGLFRQELNAPAPSPTDLPGAYPWRAGASGTAALGLTL